MSNKYGKERKTPHSSPPSRVDASLSNLLGFTSLSDDSIPPSTPTIAKSRLP